MPHIVDCRGLNCPEPVVQTKKALEKQMDLEVIVDNETALGNVRRFAQNSSCSERYETGSEGEYRIFIQKTGTDTAAPDTTAKGVSGPTVVVLSSNRMGSGDDELGTTLMKAFLHTLTELSPVPDVIIMYNSGVKLAVQGSQSEGDLKSLSEGGTAVLVCGTCVNYFSLGDNIGTGTISNMYDIASTLSSAGRIVQP